MTRNAGLVKLREGAVAWQEVDGETILLDLENSVYLGLNGSATLLWPAVAEGTTRERLISMLRAEYGLNEERAATDVDAFLSGCATRNLLEP